MRAVVIREHGGLEKLEFEERAEPEPGPSEVRVRMRAIGFNHLDVWVRRGVPGHEFPLPLIPGSEGAGVVDRVGSSVAHVREGDEVVVLPDVFCGVCERCQAGRTQLCRQFGLLGETRDGCCAELVVVPGVNVAPRPRHLGFAEIACVPCAFQTAWAMLVSKARLRPGETLLVQAGASGVGSAAVQIGKLLGAVVIATAGSAAKRQRVLALGADHVIDHAKGFVDEVRALTGKRGCDVVFEHVGAATFAGSMRSLARGGRLVTCGATSGAEVTINLRALFFKNLEILGNTMGDRGDLVAVLRLVEQQQLQPVLDRVLPFAQVQEAHRLLEARAVAGKLVLEL